MKLSRRGFVGASLSAAVALKLNPSLAADGPAPDVIDVSGSDPKKMVAAALDALGGMGKFVKSGDFVVLKANAGFANPPDWATTTHPDTVAAVAKACIDAKAKQVVVVEFPQGSAEKCFDRCGIGPAVSSLPNVKIKILTPADFQKVDVKGGVSLKSAEIAKIVLSADVLISIPAAKAHRETGVSFGLKNHMGLVKDRQAFHTQLDLHQAIADLARVVTPNLTILDATRVLLTNGPAGPGDTATPGRIIVGKSVVSVDAYGLTLARFNGKNMTPVDAKHIELAAKAGLGEADVAKLKVKKLTA
jgi:uncharacterized protein (DUF362 family)